MSVKINSKEVRDLLTSLPKQKSRAWREAGEVFRSLTPVKSGNARRNTRISDTEIHADYAYADKLDMGWSAQAPEGMSKETLRVLEAKINRDLGK